MEYIRNHSLSPARRGSLSNSRSRSPYRRDADSRSRSRDIINRRHSRSPLRRRSRSVSPMSTRKRHLGSRDEPPANKCLGVFGLNLSTSEKTLRETFEKIAPVESIEVVYDRRSGQSRGFAFITYADVEDAEDAKEKLHGTELDGRNIRVDFSITKRSHTPTPGHYMGRPIRGGRDYSYQRNGRYSRYEEDGRGYRGYRRSPPSSYRRRSRSPQYRRRSPEYGGGGYRRRSPEYGGGYRRRSPEYRRHSYTPSPPPRRGRYTRSRSYSRSPPPRRGYY